MGAASAGGDDEPSEGSDGAAGLPEGGDEDADSLGSDAPEETSEDE